MNKIRKLTIIIMCAMMGFIFFGCTSDEKLVPNEKNSEDVLKNMKTYEVDAEVTFFKDSVPHSIKMKQVVDLAGRYKLIMEAPEEIKGDIISFDENGLTHYNSDTKKEVSCKVSQARNEVLLSSFVANYLRDEKCSKIEADLQETEAICFEASIPGEFRYMNKEKLWLNKVTNVPIKMEVYDVDGNVTMLVQFDHFKYNLEIKWDTY